MPHTPESEFKNKIEAAAEFVQVGGIYRHYKSPDMIYKVARLAIFEETGEVMVGYDALYGEKVPYDRKFSFFVQEVKHENKLVSRFTLVEE